MGPEQPKRQLRAPTRLMRGPRPDSDQDADRPRSGRSVWSLPNAGSQTSGRSCATRDGRTLSKILTR